MHTQIIAGMISGSSRWRISASYFHPNHADGQRQHDFVLFEGASDAPSSRSLATASSSSFSVDEALQKSWRRFPCIALEADKRHNIMSYRRKLKQRPMARVKIQVSYATLQFDTGDRRLNTKKTRSLDLSRVRRYFQKSQADRQTNSFVSERHLE